MRGPSSQRRSPPSPARPNDLRPRRNAAAVRRRAAAVMASVLSPRGEGMRLRTLILMDRPRRHIAGRRWRFATTPSRSSRTQRGISMPTARLPSRRGRFSRWGRRWTSLRTIPAPWSRTTPGTHHGRLRRLPRALPPDRHYRLLRRGAAGLAREIHLSRRGLGSATGATRCRRPPVSGRMPARRHHHLLVYCTVHPASVDAFCTAAQQRGFDMAAGKVMMDRNAPDDLRDSAQTGYDSPRR